MKAIDTNVLARYIMQDDPDQARVAEQLLGDAVYIPITVMLETAWLLGSRYRLDRATLAATLCDLLRLPTVTVDDPEGAVWAIERFCEGADIADMLHVVAARHVDVLATFDRDFAAHAGDASGVRIETLV